MFSIAVDSLSLQLWQMRWAVQSGSTLFLGLGIVSNNFLISEYSTCRRVEWEMLRR